MQAKRGVLLWSMTVVVISGGLLAADEPKADKVKEEIKKLEGNWQVVSAEACGKARPEAEVKGLKLVIQGDSVTVVRVGGAVGGKGKLTIDPTKTPKSMDITVTGTRDDPQGGLTIQAIYEFDGDKLRMNAGPKRPKEFKTTPDSGDTELWVLKREKP